MHSRSSSTGNYDGWLFFLSHLQISSANLKKLIKRLQVVTNWNYPLNQMNMNILVIQQLHHCLLWFHYLWNSNYKFRSWLCLSFIQYQNIQMQIYTLMQCISFPWSQQQNVIFQWQRSNLFWNHLFVIFNSLYIYKSQDIHHYCEMILNIPSTFTPSFTVFILFWPLLGLNFVMLCVLDFYMLILCMQSRCWTYWRKCI